MIIICIVICKPKGRKIDTALMTHLHNSFQSNSDGFGMMWNDGEVVHIRKGFMTWKAAKRIIKKVKGFAEHVDMVFHARWATHGSISMGNTHPFPITSDITRLKALSMKTDMGIAHNGVITEYGSLKDKEDLSDTQQFIRYCLNEIRDSLTNPGILDLIKMATTSKFAIMTKDDIYLIGHFIKEKNGCYYSNRDYEYAYKVTYVNRTKYETEKSFNRRLYDTWGAGYGGYESEYESRLYGETLPANQQYTWLYCDECNAGMYAQEAAYYNGKRYCAGCRDLLVECHECGMTNLLSEMSHLLEGVCDSCFIEHFGMKRALTEEEVQDYYDSKYGVDTDTGIFGDDSDKPWEEPTYPASEVEKDVDQWIKEAKEHREKRLAEIEEHNLSLLPTKTEGM